jgi:TRAP-type mannitol/chloroaromatic compound transport system substrate-binding protein
LIVVVGGFVYAEPAKPMKLKMQVAVPTGSKIFGGFGSVANRIKELSGGRLEIEVFPAGAVVPAFEQLDACSNGVIDLSGAWTVYWTGKHPAAGLFYGASGGPFGMDYLDFLGWLYHGGGRELYQKFFDEVIKQNVHVIPTAIGTSPQPLGWFAIPITSVEDMKKVKWRIGGFSAEVWSVLGSSTVMIPAGEVLPAGERGVITGAEWTVPAEDMRMGFYDVWKHYVMPGVSEVACNGEILINKDVWNKLTPDLQALVEVAALDSNIRFLTRFARENAEALKALKTKHGVNISRTPSEVLETYLEAWDNVVARKYADKYPFFKEVLESQRKWASYVVPGRAFIEVDKLWLAKRYWPKGGEVDYNFSDVWEAARK